MSLREAPATVGRAYALLETKAVEEGGKRILRGVATTPAVDRVGDTINPMGVKFAAEMPFLWQHRHDQPIGWVKFGKPTKTGIPFEAEVAQTDEPGALKDFLDSCWQQIALKLVKAVSIGFRPVKWAWIGDYEGIEYQEIECFELSAVTIPANAEAVITQVSSAKDAGQVLAVLKNFDPGVPAATGRPTPPAKPSPGVTGKSINLNLTPKEAKTMAKTIGEQIAALEETRAAKAAKMADIMQKSIDEGRTTDASEQEEFDGLEAEVEKLDGDIKRLKGLEAAQARSAVRIDAKTGAEAAEPAKKADQGGSVLGVQLKKNEEPGIAFARLVKVKMAARLAGENTLQMAQKMYGRDSETAAIIQKANEVVAGTTLSGNWASDLVSPEGAAVAAFLEYLRPATILGKFGQGSVPALTSLDFYTPYVIETGGGAAYWVGEGKPKPLTAFDYDRSTLTPLKIANIAVLTEENIRRSSPNSDQVVRNALVKAIAAGLDVAFIDPSNNGSANVKPASITYQAATVASTGDDADDIRLDVRALFQKFIDANNAPTQGVWIMSATNALALSLMVNPLGQPEFPGLTMTGGTFQGLPAIVSEHIGDVVALVNAKDIFLGDEGGVAVDMSREASIEMRSTGLGMDATAGTATAASVSMFQTNSVALRAEREINWKRARSSAVAYLTSVSWGGAVPAS